MLWRSVMQSVMTHVVDTKVIQSLGDLNLLLGIKKGVGELLALTQGALNNLEARHIAQEVGDADIMAVRVAGSGRVRVLAGLNAGEAGVFTFEQLVRDNEEPLTGGHTIAIGLGILAVDVPIGL